MKKYDLQLLDGKLVMNLGTEENDVMVTLGYDGLPNKYDTCAIGPALVVGTVELTEHQLAVIHAEYRNGGQCGWCDEVVSKLRDPHMFDPAPGKMCKHCWNHDRQMYLGSNGVDIGPFDEEDKSESCTSCGEYVADEQAKHHTKSRER
ncbi:hypothetical protein [Tumebacillus lipolyticus]|uniref:Uncharacterized protein n=1 Tax=Tumebacillus lipolyticus TaxID=1280370 RepID=A0ABW5A2C3_9BACL